MTEKMKVGNLEKRMGHLLVEMMVVSKVVMWVEQTVASMAYDLVDTSVVMKV